MAVIANPHQTLARWAESRGHESGDTARNSRWVLLEANGPDQADWIIEVRLELACRRREERFGNTRLSASSQTNSYRREEHAMARSKVEELVTAASAGIENLTPAEAVAEIDEGDVLLIDVREPEETARGIIPSALLVPRGTLEFIADPSSPSHTPGFDPSMRVIVYSTDDSRSALAAARLQELGYRDVAHIAGGYRRWLAESWPTLPSDARVNAFPRRPATATLVVPDDQRRAMLRVELDGAWVGDLILGTVMERTKLLNALVSGDLEVRTRRLPPPDFSVADTVTGNDGRDRRRGPDVSLR